MKKYYCIYCLAIQENKEICQQCGRNNLKEIEINLQVNHYSQYDYLRYE